jgi:hypothetical protein
VLIALSGATQHQDGVVSLPDRIKGAAAQKFATSLMDQGFIRETRAKPGMPAWRSPEEPSNGGHGVAERRFAFAIPRGRSRAKAVGDFGIGRPKRNERKQPEQRRRRPRDGEIGPLPLRLDAEMRAAFLKRRFDGPTMDEPSENLDRRRVETVAQESLRIEHAGGIAHEHPTHRRRAAAPE